MNSSSGSELESSGDGDQGAPEYHALTLAWKSLFISQVDQVLTQLSRQEASSYEEVDLSGNRLGSVPGSLDKLENVVAVTLDDNRIEDIPEDSTLLKLRLEKLSVCNNRIADFPMGLCSVGKTLQRLSLDGNNLSKAHSEPWPSLGSLTRLSLINCSLASLPVGLSVLGNLEALSVSRNKLMIFPRVYGTHMPKLRELELSSNLLSAVPSTVSLLTNLSRLILASNKFSHLPDVIQTLTQLQALDVRGNTIRRLPAWIAQKRALPRLKLLRMRGNNLPTEGEKGRHLVHEAFTREDVRRVLKNAWVGEVLRWGNGSASAKEVEQRIESWDFTKCAEVIKLDLRDSGLGTIPKGISRMHNIRRLWLHKNQISELPDDCFAETLHLTALFLHHNQLRALPSSMSLLKGLRTLALNNNELEEVPRFFARFRNLRELWLHSNMIQEVPERVFAKLTKISTLSLRYNRLGALPESFCSLVRLSEVSLNGNALRAFPNMERLSNVRKLFAHENALTRIPPSTTCLVALQVLGLSSNSITEVCDLTNLKRLRHLLLHHNSISELPASLFSIAWLNILNLRDNLLQELPVALFNLVRLTHLDVTDNKLAELPEDVGRLSALMELSIGGNRIQSVPESVSRLQKLQMLDVRNNQIGELPTEAMAQLTSLTSLTMSGNPLEDPQDISGAEAIANWLDGAGDLRGDYL